MREINFKRNKKILYVSQPNLNDVQRFCRRLADSHLPSEVDSSSIKLIPSKLHSSILRASGIVVLNAVFLMKISILGIELP